MGILAAILANARRISFDVTRIERRLVEWGREQESDTILRTDQLAINSGHCTSCVLWTRSARNHRPRLGDRIDAAFIARRRSQRRTVIEPAATIPFSVPR